MRSWCCLLWHVCVYVRHVMMQTELLRCAVCACRAWQKMASEQPQSGAGGAGAGAGAAEKKAELPPWTMPSLPPPMEFWDTYYPLRIMNSLTRRKVRLRSTPTFFFFSVACGGKWAHMSTPSP